MDDASTLRIGGVGFWTVELAARHLEVTRAQVRRLARIGRIASMRVGGRVYLNTAEVEAYGRARGVWRPGGVIGGRAALDRSGAGAGRASKREG